MCRAYAPGHISANSAFVQNTCIAKRWWFKQSSWPIYLCRPIYQWPLCQSWGTIHRSFVSLLSGPRLVPGWLCPMPDWFLGGKLRKTWKNLKLLTRVGAHHGFLNLAGSQVWVWVWHGYFTRDLHPYPGTCQVWKPMMCTNPCRKFWIFLCFSGFPTQK